MDDFIDISGRPSHAKHQPDVHPQKVKFEIWGEEMIERRVNTSGRSGRIYLPVNWIGRSVKIIRVE